MTCYYTIFFSYFLIVRLFGHYIVEIASYNESVDFFIPHMKFVLQKFTKNLPFGVVNLYPHDNLLKICKHENSSIFDKHFYFTMVIECEATSMITKTLPLQNLIKLMHFGMSVVPISRILCSCYPYTFTIVCPSLSSNVIISRI